MTLTFEQLKKMTRGTVSLQEENGWIRFFRFTEAQADLLHTEAASTDFYAKTFATAGVRLSFATTSRRITFAYRVKTASARKGAWFDVYENGCMIAHFGCADESVREGFAEIVLGEGATEAEIYFPWSCAAEITLPCFDDGAEVFPLERRGTMLCFGDSITHGYDTEFPSLTYIERLARIVNTDVVNKGIGGEHFRPNMAKCPEPTLPDRILVAYGTNDWNFHKKEVLLAECKGFLQGLTEQYPAVPMYVVSPLWRTDCEKETPYGAPLQEVHQAMAEVCAEFAQVRLICGWNLMPHTKAMIFDFVHPNTTGFEQYANALSRQVQALEREQ